MGIEKNITATTFPRQGEFLGQRCRVMFHYKEPELMGTIIRDDREAPGWTIIKLDDGRVVLSTECQYSPWTEPERYLDEKSLH
jgi:hypothetical protein